MQNKDFEKKAQELVVKYFNERVESTDKNGKINYGKRISKT